MRRRFSLLVAFVGMLGMIGFAPAADAGHDIKGDKDAPHERMPMPPVPDDVDGVCAVAGVVVVGNQNGNGGVGTPTMDKNHNHYRFQEANIDCNVPGANRYTAAYDVDAAGGTDGPWADPVAETGEHGEDEAVGWSHSACYDDGDLVKAPLGCVPAANQPAGKAVQPPGNDPGTACDPGDIKKAPGENEDEDNDGRCDIDDLYDGTNLNSGSQCNNCGEIAVRTAEESGLDAKVSDPRTAAQLADQGRDGRLVGDPASSDNWVKFCRGEFVDTTTQNVCPAVGPQNVIAWGALTSIVGAGGKDKGPDVLCFLADLQFGADPKVGEKLNSATLVGDAVVWVTQDKDECAGTKGGKKD